MPGALVRLSGAHSSQFSGAAIVHRELASRLPELLQGLADFEDDRRDGEGLPTRMVGRPHRRSSRITITTSTPLPLFANSEAVMPIVFDLRWRWTRNAFGRLYRHVDLKRTTRRADHVFTISSTVADHLRVLRCHPNERVTSLRLGPGQFQGVVPPKPGDRPPTILLTGAAAHKRNELAARLLGDADETRAHVSVVGVSISEATKRELVRRFPSDRLEFLEGLSRDELASLYGRVRTYVALGVSEGFGFSYVEAAHQGCDVVAVDQPLTREVLGEHATLIRPDALTAANVECAIQGWSEQRVSELQRRALALDWDIAAEQVAAVVRSSLGS